MIQVGDICNTRIPRFNSILILCLLCIFGALRRRRIASYAWRRSLSHVRVLCPARGVDISMQGKGARLPNPNL